MAQFRAWRRKRPFWGGLFLVLAALELLYSANMNLGNLEVHLGPQGFLSYLLPLLLLLCGLLSWFTPAQRFFYGIVGLLTALYTFVGLNLGGFFLGMMLGIVGGALVIAWGPPRVRATPAADPPEDLSPDAASSSPASSSPASSSAGHDDQPTSDTAIIPGMGHPPSHPRSAHPGDGEPDAGVRGKGLGGNPRALTIVLLLVAVTGSILVAGGTMPARADECPEGLPSRSSVASSAPASAGTPSAASPSPETPAGKVTRPTPKSPATPSASAPPASPGPEAGGAETGGAETGGAETGGAETGGAETGGAETGGAETGGNPVLDGIGDFFGGVGNLLGIGDASPSPSTSPSPSESAPESSAPTSAGPSPSSPTPSVASPSESPSPSRSPSSAAATSAGASSAGASSAAEEIPCLGARVLGKEASADGIPRVAVKPGVMEVDSLTMYNSTYDGVVDLPTSGGSLEALKFSMDKAVNKPFTLTIDEPGSARTVIRSNELVTDGNVSFYTPSFKGRLFGLIPVTFTPEQPPPLTLPVLWFTDVTIQLAYVRCDTLTADPLDIRERLTSAS